MNIQRFNKKDLLVISIAILLFFSSLIFTQKYYNIAFPGQSINFQISKDEAVSKSKLFLRENDIKWDKFERSVSTFDYPDLTKIFIEKELGIKKSHTFFIKDFNIWQWSTRFFTSLEEEEVKISYSTNGDLRLFQHIIAEETALNSISQEIALEKVEEFVSKYTDLNLENWELKDKSSESKKFRVDYSFTYKKKNVEIYGAQFEIQIKVQGDQVGYFHEYLKLPEYWQREYQKIRSKNDTTGLIATVFLILLGVSSIGYFIFGSIKRMIRIRTGLIFGIITFGIFLISQFNSLPLQLYYFQTNQSFSNFYIDLIISFFVGAIIYGAAVFFLTCSGESLYRKMFPRKNKLINSFSFQGMKTKEFFDATIVGIVTAFIFISFQIVFYIIAENFGAWSPAQVSYSEIVNTKFPWIFILFSGFIPAVTEEFCFRLYGIPLINKFTKSKLFAVIITAVIWGFAHSNYLNQPFWIRGLELSIFGIVAGYIFLRFGIIATLVWHFTVNAFLTVIMFANSGNMSILIPSIITASFAFFLLGYNLFFYIKNKGFLVDENLQNKSEITEDFEIEFELPETIKHTSVTFPSFTKKQIYIILFSILVFTGSFFIPVKKLGSYFKYNTSQSEILETGKNFLNEQGIDPNRFRHAITITQDCDNSCLKYITDNTTIDSANFIFANYLPNIISYKIRFFNASKKEEFLVFIHPMDNVVTAFEHKLQEDAMSYDLSRELAQIRVEQFIIQQNYDINDFKLIESFAQVLPKRTDHTFTYESKDDFSANIKDARLRLSFVVKGDEIGYFKSWYKVPSSWTRDQNKQTPFDSFRKILQFIVMPLLLLFVLLKYKNHFNFNNINWKAILYISLAYFILFYISELITIKNQFIHFDTSWSISNFVILFIFSKFVNTMFTALLFLMIMIIGFAYYGDKNILQDIQKNQTIGFDIVLSSMFTTMGLVAIFTIQKYIAGNHPQVLSNPQILIPNYLSNPFFITNIFVKIVFTGLTSAILLYSIFTIIFKNKLLFLVSLLLLVSVLPINIDTMPEFLYSYFSMVIVILWLYISQKYFLRKNLLAYLVTGLSFFIIAKSYELISTGFNRAVVGGYFLIACLLMIIIWLLIKDKTNWYDRITS